MIKPKKKIYFNKKKNKQKKKQEFLQIFLYGIFQVYEDLKFFIIG
jgi:uncharacterized protein YhhL (DUF1145 family)